MQTLSMLLLPPPPPPVITGFDCTVNILCFFFRVLNKVYIMVGGTTNYYPPFHSKQWYSSYNERNNEKIQHQVRFPYSWKATSNYFTQTVCMKT